MGIRPTAVHVLMTVIVMDGARLGTTRDLPLWVVCSESPRMIPGSEWLRVGVWAPPFRKNTYKFGRKSVISQSLALWF